MKVIAGLGNPGKKYHRNRHNAGALVVEEICRRLSIPLKDGSFSSIGGRGAIGNEPVLALLPQTYMNNSGIAVKSALDYYRELPGSLVVIHDEVELPFGEFRHKFGGGHKGNNGIRSIMQHLGTPDFHRIRIGVGRPVHDETRVADHVLSDFNADEMTRLEDIYGLVYDFILHLFSDTPPAGDAP